MLTTYGEQTQPAVFLSVEAHKLHRSFTVAAGSIVRKTQPVKLTTDGEVVPLTAGDNRNLSIGISTHDGAAGDRVTIVMKGFSTILCKAGTGATPAAVNAGPVQYEAYSSLTPAGTGTTALPKESLTPLYGNVQVSNAAATDADLFGWAVEQADGGEFVEVVVF